MSPHSPCLAAIHWHEYIFDYDFQLPFSDLERRLNDNKPQLPLIDDAYYAYTQNSKNPCLLALWNETYTAWAWLANLLWLLCFLSTSWINSSSTYVLLSMQISGTCAFVDRTWRTHAYRHCGTRHTPPGLAHLLWRLPLACSSWSIWPRLRSEDSLTRKVRRPFRLLKCSPPRRFIR